MPARRRAAGVGEGARVVAHVTAIVSDAQVEYRVAEAHGCGPDPAVDYRVQGMGGAQLWLGAGLPDVGLLAGQEFTAEAGRALLAGVHPGTGEALVAPVLRLPETAKLPAVALVDAVVLAGAQPTGTGNGRAVREWTRLVDRTTLLGDGYTADVRLLARVAARAGLDLTDIYRPEQVAAALASAATERVDVRTRGYDLTLTLPKSFSVALALAPVELRTRVNELYTQAATEVVAAAEQWHARATRGHHGNGQQAQVVQTSGLLGWLSVDPVNRNGDTHWHAHCTLAGIGLGPDGQWSALSSSGQDSLYGSVHALGALMEARARALVAEQLGWGVRWSELTGRWELAHVPDAAIRATSTRRADVVAALLTAGIDPASATAQQQDAAGQAARKAKTAGAARPETIVERTRGQVAAEGVDPALPLPARQPSGEQPAAVVGADGWPVPTGWTGQVQLARAVLLDERDGPSAHAQSFTWHAAFAAVAGTLPAGGDAEQIALLTAAALDTPQVLRLPARAGRAGEFTTRHIAAAEQAVLRAARDSAVSRRDGPAVTDAQLAGAVAAFTDRHGYPPSPEQLTAARHITQGGGSFDTVLGLPGTGKTTVMAIVTDAYTAAGATVVGTSTAAIAVEGLVAEAGLPARTVAWHLRQPALVQAAQVLIVDEASMVDTRQMVALLSIAQGAGTKVVAVGDDRQLGAVGVGGWFTAAHTAAGGPDLVDVRRQQHEHERTALALFRAGAEHDALGVLAGAGQVTVVGTRDEALTAAALAWRDLAATVTDPLQRVEQVTLMAGRREDGQVLNELARAHARADGHLHGEDVTYRLMSGGTLRLAQGETVLLRRNSPAAGGNPALTNGQRAVVEGIDTDRNVALAWPDLSGGTRRVVLSPGDVVAGQIARSYLEADGVQGGAASTVHLAQGRTVEHAIAVLDPHQHAASYVALSRDRSSTTVVLSAEAVSDTPEDLAWLQQLPAAQRQSQVLQRYASSLHQAGVLEQARGPLEHTWPELAGSDRQPSLTAVAAGGSVLAPTAVEQGYEPRGVAEQASAPPDLAPVAATDEQRPGAQAVVRGLAEAGDQGAAGSERPVTGGQPGTRPDFLARLAAAGAGPARVQWRATTKTADPDAERDQQLARDSIEPTTSGYGPDAPGI